MITVERREDSHEITLDRPDRLNALDDAMGQALLAALADAASDRTCRAVLLTGSGRAFCAGQDLSERDPRRLDGPPDLKASVESRYNPLIRALRDSPVPVVCALNGIAAGAGVGIALACDLLLAADSARFLLAFSRIGLGPDSGVSWFLVRALGEYRARALMLRGGTLSAEEAHAAGLLASLHPAGALLSAARAEVAALAAGPAGALALTRQAIRAAAMQDLSAQLDLEAALQGVAGRTPDYAEGVLAFLEKRRPRFAPREV